VENHRERGTRGMEEKEPYQRTNPKQRKKERERK